MMLSWDATSSVRLIQGHLNPKTANFGQLKSEETQCEHITEHVDSVHSNILKHAITKCSEIVKV